MKALSVACAAILLAGAATLSAGEIESGVPEGGKIGSYSQTKCAGVDDGFAAGKTFCYTWVLGRRPVVFIFAKTPDAELASVVKAIDKFVADNSEQKVAAVVNFTESDADSLEKFAKDNQITNVALSLSGDGDKFKVNEDAALTVMAYKGKKVLFNWATDKVSGKEGAAVVKGSKAIVE